MTSQTVPASAGPQRLSRRQLDVLRGAADPAAAQELRATGLIDDDGLPTAGFGADLAAVLNGTTASITIRRARPGHRTAVEVRVAPAGVVAIAVAAADEPVDVVLAAPTSLARALWRIVQLGVRHEPTRTVEIGDAQALGAPFDLAPTGPGWLAELGAPVESAVLSRLELQTAGRPGGALASSGPAAAPVTVGLLDDGTHLWEITGQEPEWAASPSGSDAIWRTFAGWQRALFDRRVGTVTELTGSVTLPIGGSSLTLPIGHDWEPFAAGAAAPVSVWRGPDAGGFAPNVTVAQTGPELPGFAMTQELVTQALPGARALLRLDDERILAMVHEAAAGDVVTVQRYLDVAGTVQVVSYTVLAEASYDGLPLLLDAAAAVAVAT